MQILYQKTAQSWILFFSILFVFAGIISFSLSLAGSSVSAISTAHAQSEQSEMVAEDGQCIPFLRDSIKRDAQNDSLEVLKLQSFLRTVEGYDSVPLDGRFGNATEAAVKEFQKDYADEVLNPWGYSDDAATGHVYITTKNKINEILCGQEIGLTAAQNQEIEMYRNRYTTNAAASNQPSTAQDNPQQVSQADETASNGEVAGVMGDGAESDAENDGVAERDDDNSGVSTSASRAIAAGTQSPARKAAATVYTSVNSILGSMISFIFSWNFLFLLIGILIGLIISPYTHAQPAAEEAGETKEDSS